MKSLLFRVDRGTFIHLTSAAEAGSESALDALRELWGYGQADEIRCWLCSTVVGRPIIGLIFPDLDPEILCGVALCGSCAALPNVEKFDRAFEALRASERTLH